jgi:hypothetical protein
LKNASAFRALALAALASSALGAMAATNLPKEGNYDVVACWTGTGNDLALGKGSLASSYEMVGTVVSMPPGGFADRSTFRCVGMNTSMNGKMGGANICDVVDPDGDHRVNRFEIRADGSVVREMVSGTGKYEGMTQTNKVEPFPPMKEAKAGTFQGCNRQSGTYKFK